MIKTDPLECIRDIASPVTEFIRIVDYHMTDCTEYDRLRDVRLQNGELVVQRTVEYWMVYHWMVEY